MTVLALSRGWRRRIARSRIASDISPMADVHKLPQRSRSTVQTTVCERIGPAAAAPSSYIHGHLQR